MKKELLKFFGFTLLIASIGFMACQSGKKETQDQPVPSPVDPEIKNTEESGKADQSEKQIKLGQKSSPTESKRRINKKNTTSYDQSPQGVTSYGLRSQPNVIQQSVNRDRFEKIETNPVQKVAKNPVSTFSIDIDTASYSFVRSQLNRGFLPQKDAVRTEELINYFDYHYTHPHDAKTPFATHVKVYPTPWNPKTKLMHIGIKGFEVDNTEKPKANLVFLIDVSGSMQAANKLPLLKNAFGLLVENLNSQDTVTIVTYAGRAGVVLEPTKANQKEKILAALDNLSAGGSTAGAYGIKTAYNLAKANFVKDGINRILLATDGDFNVGITNKEELKGFVERMRKTGIFLSVLGFGKGNYNDALMQKLAQNGNGNAAYIDDLNEARKVLVTQAGATLFPIANDVKIQVEFNPKLVSEYRLVGYETRMLKQADFNNDKIDAGDIGAGHSVTAIYEITPTGSDAQLIDDLRYQQQNQTDAALSKNQEYAFLKLRYKLPKKSKSRLIKLPITSKQHEVFNFNELPEDYRFASAVAAFGQVLRGGEYTGSFSFDNILAIAQKARGEDLYGYRAQFVQLIRLAKSAKAM